MQQVDREGNFRAAIMSYGLKEMDSGSVAVAIKCQLLQYFDGNQWIDWEQYEMECEGDIWVVKKDGSINEGAAESLIRHAGWDGNLESVVMETWQPTKCAVTVKQEEYKGVKRMKISFVNDWERTPGGLSNINPDKAKQLQARFGGPLRAIAGNVRRNAPPSNGSKPTPPPPAERTRVAPPPSQDADIPF